jgi:hypothetical protein
MAIKLPVLATGPHFYKYGTRVDWLENIILKHELFFPELKDMHDPADGKPKLAPTTEDELATVLHKYHVLKYPQLSLAAREKAAAWYKRAVEGEGLEKCRRSIAKKLYAASTDHMRVYCLSKRWNNPGMWAKFANVRAGYCLEFAREGPLKIGCDVAYGDEAPLMDITDPDDRGPFCFFKRREFSGEEEVRVMLTPGSGPILKIPTSTLTRVLLGEHMPESDKEKIRAWVAKRKPPVPVLTAYFDDLEQEIRLR